jgi:predicted transposase/invertase (TIGR01784 family)
MMNLDIARDFFMAHLGSDLLQRIELSSLKLESSTFIDEVHKELFSDILYSVQIDDTEGYLYLLVEHQSRAEPLMGFRLLNYACRVWQAYIDKQEKILKESPKKLPMLLPLVVYNGEFSPYGCSTKLLDCFTEPELIREFLFEQFKLLDLTVIPDKELVQHQRAAFMELLAKHIRVRDILPVIEFMLNADVIGQIKHLESGSYLRFAIKYLVDKGESPDIDTALNLMAKRIPEQGETVMTIAETLERRGMQKEKLEIARKLLREHADFDFIERVTGLNEEEILTLH